MIYYYVFGLTILFVVLKVELEILYNSTSPENSTLFSVFLYSVAIYVFMRMIANYTFTIMRFRSLGWKFPLKFHLSIFNNILLFDKTVFIPSKEEFMTTFEYEENADLKNLRKILDLNRQAKSNENIMDWAFKN